MRGSHPLTRAALDWLDHKARPGHCGATSIGGDCLTGSKGSFKLEHGGAATFSWLELAERCLVRCLSCERCHVMTIAIIHDGLWAVDCSWYHSCAHPTLAPGFYHGAVPRQRAAVAPLPLPPPFAWPEVPPLPRSAAAIALQMSGHMQACSYPSVTSHLAACRARFARCDLFVHTWASMAPATIHWSGRHHRARNTSSAPCVRQLKTELRPAAVAVDEQGAPPAHDAPPPDGQPWTERGAFQWGPERYWAYTMTLRGMHGAGQLRRRLERRDGVRYAAALRLRPDDHADGGFAGLKQADYAPLWDCIRAKTGRYAAKLSPHRVGAGAGGVGTATDGAESATATNTTAVASADQFELVGCAPTAVLSVGSTGNDNCFFGPTRAMDALLRTFERNASGVYAFAKARGASLSRAESALLPAAAAMAGVRLASHAYVPGSPRQPTPVSTSCHRDDLRLLLLPDAEGLEPTEYGSHQRRVRIHSHEKSE